MLFQKTTLKDAVLIDLQRIEDDRGYFARTFSAKDFEAQGLSSQFVQQNLSTSARAGTVRGMHYQKAPHGEAKLIRCLRGAIYDVIIDLRPDSPTYRQWEGFKLNAENQRQLYIPQGFAHGFQTLVDDVEVSYLVSAYYTPEAETGLRHDDPMFAITWPQAATVVSDKDRTWPDFTA